MPNPLPYETTRRRRVDFFAVRSYVHVMEIEGGHSVMMACGLAVLAWGCSGCNSQPSAPDAAWPTATPEEKGFDSAALASVVERIDREDLPIDSVQIVREGVLVLDAYFFPYLGEQPHDVASVTKSITSTLVGIAVDRGLLRLDQRVLDFFEELAPPSQQGPKSAIELQHLLTMSSGLQCGYLPGEQELYSMIASEHYVRYALGLPMAAEPGAQFAYCSPGSHLMSAMVSTAAEQPTHDFARENLFEPLGIDDSVWPTDPQGVNHGWGDLQLHPRDMARIGYLLLREGDWNGRQLVSEEWIEQATRRHITAGPDDTGYGYQWWILAGELEGIYEARGRGGQAIIIWPEVDVVAVFTGRGIDVRNEIAPLLAAALISNDSLDPNPEGYARLKEAIRAATDPPAAKPVPELPAMAETISGKAYRLAANQFDVRCITLQFESSEDVLLVLTVGEGRFELPVGTDGVPRFSESGPTGIPVGVTGAWTQPTVFEMAYDEVAGPNHLQIRGDFASGGQSVSLLFTDPAGYFPPQTVPANADASGDCR